MKTITILTFLILAVLARTAATQGSEIPHLMNYQGRITSDSNVCLNDTLPMTISIYDSAEGGNLLWSQGFPGVEVNMGLFDVTLGSGGNEIPESVFENDSVYLHVAVDGEPMVPRTHLVSMPFSFRSATSDTAEFARNCEVSTGWVDDGTSVRLESADDYVGIGTSSPSEKLSVSGNIHATGSLMSGSSIVIDGTLDQMTASSGVISFDDEDLTTTGKVRFGPGNTNNGVNAFVVGQNNSANGDYSTVGGGKDNDAAGISSFIGGGSWNETGSGGAICGGESNIAGGSYSFIGGGTFNKARGNNAAIAGGGGTTQADSNSASGDYSYIGGGQRNVSSGSQSTVTAGYANKAEQVYSTVCGGANNTAAGVNSTVCGGNGNTASGPQSTVIGGSDNSAEGANSVAAGKRAHALHEGCFVWADNTDADFSSTSGKQFLIRASGGVGIGKSSPSTALDVDGTATMTGFVMPTGANDGYVLKCNGAGVGSWQPESGGSNGWVDDGTSVRLETVSDYVGIGTNEPLSRLHVKGNGYSGNNAIRIEDSYYGTNWMMLSNADGFRIAERLEAGNQYAITITPSAGYVGIRKSIPSKPLDVLGDALITGTLTLQKPSDQSNLVFKASNGTTRGFIRAEESTDILTYHASGAKHVFEGDVDVEGDLCYTGSFGACSDQRFKKNVRQIDSAMKMVGQLRGVTYDWRKDEFPEKSFDDESHIGFIAQELLKIIPDAVTTDAEGYHYVDYGKLTPLLVEALKEQQELIAKLSSRLDLLEATADR